MHRKILFFQHDPEVPPGIVENILRKKGFSCHRVDLYKGNTVRSLDGVEGVVLLGGEGSVHDGRPLWEWELPLIQEGIRKGVRFLGICLGAQVLSKLLGGKVSPLPVPEVGFVEVEVEVKSFPNSILSSLPHSFYLFQWHREFFTIPPSSYEILRGKEVREQGFVWGKVLGIQGHIEIEEETIRSWLQDLSVPEEKREKILKEIPYLLPPQQVLAEKIVDLWLSL